MRSGISQSGKGHHAVRKLAAAAVIGVTALASGGRPAGAACTSLLRCSTAPTTTTVLATPATTQVTVPAALAVTTIPLPASRDDVAGNVRLLTLMNAERARNNLKPFSLRADVTAISLSHSRAMATKHEIWHNDDYFSSANRSRLGAGAMAENVAMNRTVEAAHLALMNSPHHRDNLLDPRMTVVGLGIAIDNRNMVYVTQNFLQPRTAAAPTPPPASPAAAPAPRTGAATHPRPVAARPVTSPTVRPPSPVAVNPQATPMNSATLAATGQLVDRQEIVQGPDRLRLEPVGASGESTGLQLAIIWVAGLLFLSSLPPTLRLAWSLRTGTGPA